MGEPVVEDSVALAVEIGLHRLPPGLPELEDEQLKAVLPGDDPEPQDLVPAQPAPANPQIHELDRVLEQDNALAPDPGDAIGAAQREAEPCDREDDAQDTGRPFRSPGQRDADEREPHREQHRPGHLAEEPLPAARPNHARPGTELRCPDLGGGAPDLQRLARCAAP